MVTETVDMEVHVSALNCTSLRGDLETKLKNIHFKKSVSNNYYCCCSDTQLCLTLATPINCNMPGFPVLHYLPEFSQAHVHWVSERRESGSQRPWLGEAWAWLCNTLWNTSTLQWQSWGAAEETSWAAKPRTFPLWSLTENYLLGWM